MAQKKDSKKKKIKDDEIQKDGYLSDETKRGIWGIVCFVLSIFFFLAIFGKAGVGGNLVHSALSVLLGIGYFMLPLVLVLLGTSLLGKSERPNIGITHTVSSLLILLSTLGIIDVASATAHKGGILGQAIAYPFVQIFDIYIAILFLGTVLVVSLLVLFDYKPRFRDFYESIVALFAKKEMGEKEPEIKGIVSENEENEEEIENVPEKEEVVVENKEDKKAKKEEDAGSFFMPKKKPRTLSSYVPPPLSLLANDKGKPNVGDIKANANIIQRTLANFGIQVEMDEITIGPTVTRYALKPAQGVKLSRIAGLQNDLALALAAHPIRMELPIPGKSLVGIEIPNKQKSTVGLGSLLSDQEFQNSTNPLYIALGRNVSGKSLYMNLAKAPHVLIAGTTGSGKSVMIHNLITSLLYRNGPDSLKLILVDPKRVELTLYNKIPHLLTPVITDAKKCILALKWAAKEMERRYNLLEANAVRDIHSYHENVYEEAIKKGDESADPMPYIVVVIDELADIMQTYPRELEAAIVRLAQMSRAVGIHLVLSTQRPEVNVITGLIKANVPTRLAFRVPTQIDSRTILDAAGAEKLLGSGDMLYSSGEGAPQRLQSSFIPENEVKSVAKYLADTYRDEIPNEIEFSGSVSDNGRSIFDSGDLDSNGDGDEDDLYEDARQTVIEAGKASTSFLQRKLKVGYSRAARLIDMLEERGVIGAGDGAKPREVLEKSVGEEMKEYE